MPVITGDLVVGLAVFDVSRMAQMVKLRVAGYELTV
jgi:hypothetical protein